MRSILFVSSFVVLGLVAAACGSDDDDNGSSGTGATGGSGGSTGGSGGSTGGSGGSTGGSGGSTGGSAGTGGGNDGGAEMAMARVAHLSPDAPAVDFCVDGGSGFIGPVLKGAGDTDGLAYSEVTQYLPLPAGTYDVRLVAPNAADCTTALGGLPDVEGVALAADAAYTAAATGMLTPPSGTEPFAIELYADTITATNAAKAYVRFIHASADTPAVDVGTGSGGSFTAVWSNVEFPNVGDAPGGGDYLETDPLTNVTLSARASGTTADALVLNGVSVPAGAVVTAFAIGNLGGAPQPLKVLVCIDSASPQTCSVLP
jgi:hypothetical protein